MVHGGMGIGDWRELYPWGYCSGVPGRHPTPDNSKKETVMTLTHVDETNSDNRVLQAMVPVVVAGQG